ncbi:MAG: T9SS type A sorting domain-containing protein, partial [Flavobacteriales bacterium]|nr:T9SS type A sorting domain-containing protein [Flavobacteriales bacterium]
YANDLHCRWEMLRSSSLSNAHIESVIDSIATYIEEASMRHYTTFNIETEFITNIQLFKDWTFARLAWMDAHMPGTCWGVGVDELVNDESLLLFPNPTQGDCQFQWISKSSGAVRAKFFDLRGKLCAELIPERIAPARFRIDLNQFAPGTYIVNVSDGQYNLFGKIEVVP